MGDSEVITFDGQLLSYSGNCEYLLAADIRYKTWAASVKYFQNTLSAINVYVDGQMIEFLKQYKVKIKVIFIYLFLFKIFTFYYYAFTAFKINLKILLSSNFKINN